MEEQIARLKQWVDESENIVFFGGAGVSTESGIPDFRSANGIYSQRLHQEVRPEERASHSFLVNHTEAFFEFYREYPTLWSGEYTTGWWWYLPASELDLSAITPEAGQTIRITFAHHDEPQQFCL